MITIEAMAAAIRDAWADIPAPPTEDLKYMAWGWGEDAYRAFAGVKPVDVDISSPGFNAATPLLDLPPRAAAAYLGTYVLSLLHSLALQEKTGLFADLITRAHLIHCLTTREFWRGVIRPHLPPECKQVLVPLAACLGSRKELLALSQEEVDLIAALAEESLTTAG
jgi:hypothetical protein